IRPTRQAGRADFRVARRSGRGSIANYLEEGRTPAHRHTPRRREPVSTQAAPVSSVPETPGFVRHALGMPAGSVRALLAFAILIYLWVMALATTRDGAGLLAQKEAMTAFIYLQLVMVLILCHFVVAHGKTIGHRVSRHSPLWMPRGSVRILLLAGYFGLA